MKKQSKANLTPKRQRTQYSCMATSMSMCLQALGYPHANEDEVNKVMGALPMRGAAWEQALACAQHYGCRATLTMPSTVRQLKEWTDRGVPVMIAWNPEGRDWSHASVVFDVSEDMQVSVADPNMPNPEETVRVLSANEFYQTWYEKWPNYLVRRPACAIEREITPDGKQIMASKKENTMSKKQELRKIAQEIREIKAELNKSAVFPIYTSILMKEFDLPHNKINEKDIKKYLMQNKRYWASFDSLTRNMTKESKSLWKKNYYAGKDKQRIEKIMDVKVLSFETTFEFDQEDAVSIVFEVQFTIDSDFIVV